MRSVLSCQAAGVNIKRQEAFFFLKVKIPLKSSIFSVLDMIILFHILMGLQVIFIIWRQFTCPSFSIFSSINRNIFNGSNSHTYESTMQFSDQKENFNYFPPFYFSQLKRKEVKWVRKSKTGEKNFRFTFELWWLLWLQGSTLYLSSK